MDKIIGNRFELELKELDPKVRDKATEISKILILEKKYAKEVAIKEGIKQAKAWFIDLEG